MRFRLYTARSRRCAEMDGDRNQADDVSKWHDSGPVVKF